jgi:quinolinate synthase
MKMITLERTLDSLRHLQYEITLPEEVRVGAERSLDRMLELSA